MNADSIDHENRKVHNLTDELEEENNGSHQEVIVVDGRGYENDSHLDEEVYNLVDIIHEHQADNNRYEDILQRVEKIVESITRKMFPEIAERIIKEEIEKLKKNNTAES
ncbi:MAG: hypothetical protein JW925_07540 [Syntrophaceae bacterium]|nr:hypothetical protein [Syntrophaceae bacterium]